jgi:hypothetical protein
MRGSLFTPLSAWTLTEAVAHAARVNQTMGGQFTRALRALGEFAAAAVLVNTASFATENTASKAALPRRYSATLP